MFREERLQNIIEILNESGSVTVLGLKDKYQVSAMTIRRDLITLEDRGLIERTHGGALLSEETRNLIDPPIIERMNVMAEEKDRSLGGGLY